MAARIFGTKRIASFVGRTHRDISSAFELDDDRGIRSAVERSRGDDIQQVPSEKGDDPGAQTSLVGLLPWKSGVLRAAILGVNDGLVSNFGLVMGVAGGSGDSGLIALAGIAGMLSGAISMGVGEYISIRSQRDFFEHMIGREKKVLEQRPEQVADDIARVYEDKGLYEAGGASRCRSHDDAPGRGAGNPNKGGHRAGSPKTWAHPGPRPQVR